MREVENLLVCQTSRRRPLYIGNMEGILGIEVLNAKKRFWIKYRLLLD